MAEENDSSEKLSRSKKQIFVTAGALSSILAAPRISLERWLSSWSLAGERAIPSPVFGAYWPILGQSFDLKTLVTKYVASKIK
jgi:hypothetical protein